MCLDYERSNVMRPVLLAVDAFLLGVSAMGTEYGVEEGTATINGQQL